MKINRETQIGLLVTVAIAMLIWGINFLKGRNLFASEKTYYAVYNKIDGLSESASVLVNGYNIGIVSDIELNQNNHNQLIITMGIHKKYDIPLNTVAQIQSTGFIGGKSIALRFPDKITGYHQDKDTLNSRYKEGMDALVEKAESTAEEMVNSIDSILTSLNKILDNDTQKHLKSIFENLDVITQELSTTLNQGGDLDRSLKNLEVFSGSLASNAENLDNVSANISTFSDSLTKLDINKTLTELNDVLKQSKNMLQTVNSAQGTAGKLVYDDSLYTNLNQVTISLNHLLKDLKENPNRYVHFSLFDRKEKENSPTEE